MKIVSYKDLLVWKKSFALVKSIYALTNKLPKEEIYGLTSQLRRSAVSIPSNIAEGKQRGTRKDYANFIRLSLGSAAELETQLLLINDLYGVEIENEIEEVIQIKKMLTMLIKKLKSGFVNKK